MCVLRRDDDEIRWCPFSCASIALPSAFSIFDAKEGQLQRLVEWVAVPPYVNTHACYSICEMRAREPLPATAVAFFELEPADLNQRVYSDRVSFSSPQ